MFNLLPQKEQQEVAREYRLRLASASLLFFAAFGSIALVALIPSLSLSYQKESDSHQIVRELKLEVENVAKDDPTTILKLMNKKVSALSLEQTNLYSYQLVRKIVEGKVPGIKIFGISINNLSDGRIDINVLGESRDRDTLSRFADKLKEDRDFSSVIVPISNFAPVADINFSINIRLSDKNSND